MDYDTFCMQNLIQNMNDPSLNTAIMRARLAKIMDTLLENDPPRTQADVEFLQNRARMILQAYANI